MHQLVSRHSLICSSDAIVDSARRWTTVRHQYIAARQDQQQFVHCSDCHLGTSIQTQQWSHESCFKIRSISFFPRNIVWKLFACYCSASNFFPFGAPSLADDVHQGESGTKKTKAFTIISPCFNVNNQGERGGRLQHKEQTMNNNNNSRFESRGNDAINRRIRKFIRDKNCVNWVHWTFESKFCVCLKSDQKEEEEGSGGLTIYYRIHSNTQCRQYWYLCKLWMSSKISNTRIHWLDSKKKRKQNGIHK